MTLLMLGSSLAIGQDAPKDVHQNVSKTNSTAADAQIKADDWSYEKRVALEEIRNLKYRITWLNYRQEKNRIYIEGVKENIANLEFQKAELNRLREQLEPYLEDVIDRLDAFVAQDIPFLPEERQKRITDLRDSMNNYNVPLSEKMRRVFAEGLQIETQYGKMIEAWEDVTLNLDGADTQVTIFRLGRVGMIYMSIDQTQVGRWSQDSGKWEPLPEDQIRNIRVALDMAQRRRAAEIVDLPIGAY
jgi:hypothetical protein